MATKKSSVEFQPNNEELALAEAYLSNQLSDADAQRFSAYLNNHAAYKRWFMQYKQMRTRSRTAQGGARSGGARNGTRQNADIAGAGYTSPSGLNRNLQNRGGGGWGGSSRVTSPGGFKKSGQDEDSDIRRSGQRTDQRDFVNEAEINEDGSADFNGKHYSKSQVEWIKKRGRTGATMAIDAQSIYDRYKEMQRKEAEDKQKAKNDDEQKRAQDKDKAENKARTAKLRQYLDIPENIVLSKSQLDEIEHGRATIRDGMYVDWDTLVAEGKERTKRAYDWQTKQDEREYQQERNRAYNKAVHGIDLDVKLSEADLKDYKDGRKVWDYAADDMEEVNELKRMQSEIKRSDDYSEADKAMLLASIEGKLSKYEKQLVPNPNPPTIDQAMERTKDGLAMDNSGKLYAVPKTTSQAQAERDLSRQQKLEDQKAKAQEERKRFIAAQVMKAKQAYDKLPPPTGKDDETLPKPDFDEKAVKDMLIRLLNDGAIAVDGSEEDDDIVSTAYDEHAADEAGVDQFGDDGAPAGEVEQPMPQPDPQVNRNVNWRDKFGGAAQTQVPQAATPEMVEAEAELCAYCGQPLDEMGFCATEGCPNNPGGDNFVNQY